MTPSLNPSLTGGVNTFAAWAVTLVILLTSLVVATADTIYLQGGEKLIGKVITDEPEKLVIKSQTLGKIEVPRERVERIELDSAPAAPPAQGFVPSPPVVSTTNPPAVNVGSTNEPAKRRWFWQAKKQSEDTSADWIQLKSGEWLRGRLYGMQNRKLEFDSDELNDVNFDWKDVYQVIMPHALVSYGDRDFAWGELHVDRENVNVAGYEWVSFPRYDLIGIAPGTPRERDYWSGKFDVGLNLRAGNTEQADLFTKAKLERRTPRTHLKLEYVGNFSEVEGVETVNNRRATEYFDIFLKRRLFLRVPQFEYYRDPFQNIDSRFTVIGGAGYYLIDKPKTEWQIAGGPGYQGIRYDTVQPGQNKTHSTAAFGIQSSFETDLTRRTDLELDYQATVANQVSGGITHHATVTLEIDLTRRLDLDLTFVWDRIGNPQAESSGNVPKNDDYRLNLSLGVKF